MVDAMSGPKYADRIIVLAARKTSLSAPNYQWRDNYIINKAISSAWRFMPRHLSVAA